MNTDALKAAKDHNPKSPGKFEAEQKATEDETKDN